MMLSDSLLPDEIMALTIYGEARGESIEGQIAVANVIMNRWRANLTKFKTVKEVCLEPFQFSCWNKSDPNYDLLERSGQNILDGKQLDSVLKQCLYISRGVMGFNLNDNTRGAKNYMTTQLLDSDRRPGWAKNRTNELMMGN